MIAYKAWISPHIRFVSQELQSPNKALLQLFMIVSLIAASQAVPQTTSSVCLLCTQQTPVNCYTLCTDAQTWAKSSFGHGLGLCVVCSWQILSGQACMLKKRYYVRSRLRQSHTKTTSE